MSTNAFLDSVALELRCERPAVPPSFDHTVWEEQSTDYSFAQIWFRTEGCLHSRRGGCTACDYWAGSRVSADQMVAAVRSALSQLSREPTFLLLNASGSMLDQREVPVAALGRILQLLADSQFPVILETRADTITAEILDFCAAIIGPHRLQIEIGLESSNAWILQNCINKNMHPNEALRACATASSRSTPAIANVLLGPPFLSQGEAVSDVFSTIHWALESGFDRVVVFPCHIKPWTVSDLLHRVGHHHPISLWALVDLLALLEPTVLTRTEIAWTRARTDLPPGYESPLSPTTCSQCASRIHALLDQYRFSADRTDLVSRMAGTSCKCRDAWRESLAEDGQSPLPQRVAAGYEAMANHLFGRKWWSVNGTATLKSVLGGASADTRGETSERRVNGP